MKGLTPKWMQLQFWNTTHDLLCWGSSFHSADGNSQHHNLHSTTKSTLSGTPWPIYSLLCLVFPSILTALAASSNHWVGVFRRIFHYYNNLLLRGNGCCHKAILLFLKDCQHMGNCHVEPTKLLVRQVALRLFKHVLSAVFSFLSSSIGEKAEHQSKLYLCKWVAAGIQVCNPPISVILPSDHPTFEHFCIIPKFNLTSVFIT